MVSNVSYYNTMAMLSSGQARHHGAPHHHHQPPYLAYTGYAQHQPQYPNPSNQMNMSDCNQFSHPFGGAPGSADSLHHQNSPVTGWHQPSGVYPNLTPCSASMRPYDEWAALQPQPQSPHNSLSPCSQHITSPSPQQGATSPSGMYSNYIKLGTNNNNSTTAGDYPNICSQQPQDLSNSPSLQTETSATMPPTEPNDLEITRIPVSVGSGQQSPDSGLAVGNSDVVSSSESPNEQDGRPTPTTPITSIHHPHQQHPMHQHLMQHHQQQHPALRAVHLPGGRPQPRPSNGTMIHQHHSARPATVRSPYEWMKKPSYQSQPPSEVCANQPYTWEEYGRPARKTRTKDKYRVVYSDHQRLELEKEFHYSRYITIRRKSELAAMLGLSERQVKIWFQNRRAKERKQAKKREELMQKEKIDAAAKMHAAVVAAHNGLEIKPILGLDYKS